MAYELILQDCIEWMNLRDKESVDCVITSPPYNLNIKYGSYKDDLPRDSYLKWLNDVAESIKKVLKEDGHLFLNVGFSNIDPWVSMDVANVFRKHFVLQNNITWVKHILLDDQSYGIHKPITSDRFSSPTTESIYHFTKTGEVKVDRLAIGHRNTTHERYPDLYTESRHIAEQRRKASKKLGYRDWLDFKKNYKDGQLDEFNKYMEELENKKPWDPERKKCLGTAWYIPYTPIAKMAKRMDSKDGDSEGGRGSHPATFPEALSDMCIGYSGISEGSVVYDPFSGTGTTVISSIKSGMYGIGTDIDENYIRFSKERIEAIYPSDGLF